MRIHLTPCLAALAVVAFACPVWAHTESAPLTLMQPAKIGSTSLKPGTYTLTANNNMNEVMVKHNGRVVATVPAKKVTLKRKSPYTAVVFNRRQIQEIQFEGKVEAIQLESSPKG